METKNGKGGLPASAIDPLQAMQAAQAEHFNDLMTGKSTSTNEYAQYILGQLKGLVARGIELSKELTSAHATVSRLEEEARRIEVVANQYAKDLQKWDPKLAPRPGGGDKDETTHSPS